MAFFGKRKNRELDSLDRNEQVAICAILIAMGEADHDFIPEERAVIADLLMRRYSLDEVEATQLMEDTLAASEAGKDLASYTATLAARFTPAQKRSVLVMVWRVIMADNYLHPNEQKLAEQLTTMLGVGKNVLQEAHKLAMPAHPQVPEKEEAPA